MSKSSLIRFWTIIAVRRAAFYRFGNWPYLQASHNSHTITSTQNSIYSIDSIADVLERSESFALERAQKLHRHFRGHSDSECLRLRLDQCSSNTLHFEKFELPNRFKRFFLLRWH